MCSATSHLSGEVQPGLTGALAELDRRWLGRRQCRHLCSTAGSAPELGALVDLVQSLLVPSVTSLLWQNCFAHSNNDNEDHHTLHL